jgi:hypothetical protein
MLLGVVGAELVLPVYDLTGLILLIHALLPNATPRVASWFRPSLGQRDELAACRCCSSGSLSPHLRPDQRRPLDPRPSTGRSVMKPGQAKLPSTAKGATAPASSRVIAGVDYSARVTKSPGQQDNLDAPRCCSSGTVSSRP